MNNTSSDRVVVQRLQKGLDDEYLIAEKYYSILSAVNSLSLTKRELELVAYTAVRGSISYANTRTDFCKRYGTTTATINNIVSKLKKIGIFVKEDGKIKVNPLITLPFKKNLNLVIKLVHNETTGKEAFSERDSGEKAVKGQGDFREGDKPSDQASV